MPRNTRIPSGYTYLKRLLVDHNQLLLLLDNRGTITAVITRYDPSPEWTSLDFYRQSLKGKRVDEFYSISLAKGLRNACLRLDGPRSFLSPETLFAPRFVYPSKNSFEGVEIFSEFFSKIPYSRLYLRRSRRLGYFGIVRFNPITSVSYHYRPNPFLMVDGKGRIQAVNGSLVRYFSGKSASGRKFLERAVTQFVTPSPLDLLMGKEGDFQALRQEPWKKVFSIPFGPGGLSTAGRHVCLDDIRMDRERAIWTPSVERRSLIPLLEPVDTFRTDFKLEFSVTLEGGDLPSVVINGSPDYRNFFPDFNGYLLGPDPAEPFFQIKKEGRLLHRTGFSPDRADPLRIEVIKRGLSLAYFINGRLVLGYRDPRLYVNGESYQYFFCRRPERLVLRALELSTLPAERALDEGFNEVRVAGKEEQVLRFYPLAEYASRQGKNLFYSFALEDISALKKNIGLLQKARASMARERDQYKALALGSEGAEPFFVGEHPSILRIKREALRAAETGITVLIEGETGTGKEVLAKYIHSRSRYKDGPFVKVDCSTLPENLLESELFGAEKGAFTGAHETRAGKLEASNDGTLFLDELGNLNLPTQAKFLQFLQDFTLERLGSTKKVKVRTRIVAATNRPLKALVDAGLFRSDLYYRLSGVRFSIPPLKDRRDDLPRLCAHFLKQFNEKFDRTIRDFSKEAVRKVLSHDWPGNVREIENVVQKAVLFCEGDRIEKENIELPASPNSAGPTAPGPGIPVGDSRALTRDNIESLLDRNHGIAVRAAREAGVSRNTFFRKMKKFGVRKH